MKRKYLLAFAFIFSLTTMYGQGEMDAYKFSRNDLKGSARAMGMGGAFGALGDDLTAISINPAGVGTYIRSEAAITFNFQNSRNTAEVAWNKSLPMDNSKFKFTADNISFVGVMPTNNDEAPFVNFGVTYNRLKDFNRVYQTRGVGMVNKSMTDYMAERAKGYKPTELGSTNGYAPWDASGVDWMAIFGYNSGLIVPTASNNQVYKSSLRSASNIILPYDQELTVEETGGINSYDFSLGTTFSDMLSAGVTLSITDISYTMNSTFIEDFVSGNKAGGYDFWNQLETKGTGAQVALGLIFKPVEQFRIGVSYHSPTWYDMTDYYRAEVWHNLTELKSVAGVSIDPAYTDGVIRTFDDANEVGQFDYTFRTPDKWTFSLTGLIGKFAKINVDYDYTNYSNMKLHDDRGYALSSDSYYDPNTQIKRDFKNSSSLRIGLEYRVSKQFAVRAGYSWVESPVKDNRINNIDDEIMTAGTVAHYTLDGDTHYLTYGLGYRFTKDFYTDVAFVYSTQEDDVYSYWGAEKFAMKTDKMQGVLTFGYRF